jgi:predicted chitinase
MLISPPFLPNPSDGESESDWLARAMVQPTAFAPESRALEGSFPVSAAFMWHNGLHLVAPMEADAALPVRAVADGTVIFVHSPDDDCGKDAIAQQYMPDQSESWTDNGCVIVRHTTEIGAAGTVPVTVIYYSLYMHLKSIEAGVRHGKPIYRKDAIGAAGQFYGAAKQLHFEISCDPDYLRAIVARQAEFAELEPPVVPTENGRTDAVFGSLYIYLSPGTPISRTQPSSHVYAPSQTALEEALWVEIRYDKGSAFLRTYDAFGAPLGSELPEVDFEYELYNEATKRHDSASKESNASPSSPSGWYELLRFGRNLGPDPLPSYAAHWRKIRTAAGIVWADLNAPGSFQFSEADFLPVMGWNFFHDDPTPDDQRCDSVNLKRWIQDIDDQNERRLNPIELRARLGDDNLRRKLRRAICNFPTEWDRKTIEARHAWLRGPEQNFGLDDDANWNRFLTHCKAMSFDDLPDEYKAATWRFHPGEFIAVMRRCGWLSLREASFTLPRYMFYTPTGTREAITTPESIYELKITDALARMSTHVISLNIVMRKYCLTTCLRQSHFLAQVILETAQWRSSQSNPSIRLMHEWYFGQYSPRNAMTQYYGPFYGRGIMQLTWAGNYLQYGAYRTEHSLPNNTEAYDDALTPTRPRITSTSKHWTFDPRSRGSIELQWSPRYDPNVIATDPYNACDSGAFYWVSKPHAHHHNINRICDQPYSTHAVHRVSVLVNGGGNGYHERQAYAAYLTAYFDDKPDYNEIAEVQTERGNISVNYSKPL